MPIDGDSAVYLNVDTPARQAPITRVQFAIKRADSDLRNKRYQRKTEKRKEREKAELAEAPAGT